MGLGLLEGVRDDSVFVDVFAADVNVDAGGLDCMSGDGEPFKHFVRLPQHGLAVFEGAGFGFVGVADYITFGLGLLANRRPLKVSRKPRAAPTLQTGRFQLLDDLLGGHLFCFCQVSIRSIHLAAQIQGQGRVVGSDCGLMSGKGLKFSLFV